MWKKYFIICLCEFWFGLKYDNIGETKPKPSCQLWYQNPDRPVALDGYGCTYLAVNPNLQYKNKPGKSEIQLVIYQRKTNNAKQICFAGNFKFFDAVKGKFGLIIE